MMKLKLTRRHMLMLSLFSSLGFVPGLAGTAARAQGQLVKSRVQYQEKPKGGKQCSGCRFFKAPHSCEKVKGNISPNGWCMLWSPKG